MTSKKIERDVFERLLLAKALLSGARVASTAHPDKFTVARHILVAHDAAELVFSAISGYVGCTISERFYLMDYVGAIKTTMGRDVPHRQFFSNLNHQRVGVKHRGLMPDTGQWSDVGELTYRNASKACQEYLGIRLDDVDESLLVQHEEVKVLLAEARIAYQNGEHQSVLEKLGHALWVMFKDSENPALRGLGVGRARAEDAIRLSVFGVNANEFLAMQEFLPRVREVKDKKVNFEWEQDPYGHPANWTAEAAEFCLKTFIHVAVRIQNAPWILSAIDILYVYDQKVTALEDNVEVVQLQLEENTLGQFFSPSSGKTIVVHRLSKGESIVGRVTKNRGSLFPSALDRSRPGTISFHGFLGDDKLWGDIEESKVRVTCVPRDSEFVKKWYPTLPEIEWDPKE